MKRELAIGIDEMRNNECKPCWNTQLNRLVENTQRQQHNQTHKAKHGRLHHSIHPSLTSTQPFLTLQGPPPHPKKNIRFLMQILICSHDRVQDQVVDPMHFQTTWAIYRNEVNFLSTGTGFPSKRQIQRAPKKTLDHLASQVT